MCNEKIAQINGDNCVLTDQQISMINNLFEETLRRCIDLKYRKIAKKDFDEVFLKITKLNDIVREQNK